MKFVLAFGTLGLLLVSGVLRPHLRWGVCLLLAAFCVQQNVCSVNRTTDIVSQVVTVLGACAGYTASTALFFLRQKELVPVPLGLALISCAVSYVAVSSSRTNLSDQFGIFQFAAFVCMFHVVAAALYLLSRLHRLLPLVAAIVVVVLAVAKALTLSFPSPRRGLLHATMSLPWEYPTCPIPVDFADFMSAVRPGTLSLYMGTSRCPAVRTFSRLENHVLYVNCSHKNRYVVAGSDYFPHLPSSQRQHLFRLEQLSSPLARVPLNGTWSVVRTTEHFPRHLLASLRVVCGSEVNAHVQLVPKRRRRRSHGRERNTRTSKRNPAKRMVPNVMVLFVDALSRLQFYRRMPLSARVVESLHHSNHTSLFQFFRYVVLGHSTTGNLPMMLQGRYDHPSYTSGSENCSDARLDRFWWSTFQRRHGHATVFVNNMCEDVLLAIHGGPGRHLDHHFVDWCCQPEYDAYSHHSNLIGPYSLRRRCIAGRYVHEYSFDYLRQAWDAYARASTPRASFAIFTENHEGTMDVVGTVDRDLAAFLEWMAAAGHLRDTVVMITADHGLHMGPYYLTQTGQLEHKLPLLLLCVPPVLLRQYPELRAALAHNEQATLTPWDIYATLRHLATLPDLPPRHELSEAYPHGPPWAQSLLTKLPYNRTCEAMHVPPCRCVCEGQFTGSDGCGDDAYHLPPHGMRKCFENKFGVLLPFDAK